MRNLLKYFMLALVATLAACSTESNDEQAAAIDQTGAFELGQKDAKALSLANYQADQDLHAALLAVKSREWKMRERGNDIGANAYIEGFTSYIKENDKPLAGKIF